MMLCVINALLVFVFPSTNRAAEHIGSMQLRDQLFSRRLTASHPVGLEDTSLGKLGPLKTARPFCKLSGPSRLRCPCEDGGKDRAQGATALSGERSLRRRDVLGVVIARLAVEGPLLPCEAVTEDQWNAFRAGGEYEARFGGFAPLTSNKMTLPKLGKRLRLARGQLGGVLTLAKAGEFTKARDELQSGALRYLREDAIAVGALLRSERPSFELWASAEVIGPLNVVDFALKRERARIDGLRKTGQPASLQRPDDVLFNLKALQDGLDKGLDAIECPRPE